MLMKPTALATALICLACATPVLAKAITYTGTLGGQAIVLELTEIEDGPMFGRYSDQSSGADIPLRPLRADKDDAVLGEEVACTSALCERPDGNLVLHPPLGAQFSLHFSADRMKLTGTWRASASAGALVPVDLVRFGQRGYRRDGDFYGAFVWDIYSDAAIAPDTSPYDYAKMQVALTEGPLQTKDGATYRNVTDPRTKFGFPRIVSLPGGGDVAPINAALDQRRWAINFVGFQCLSMDYLGGGWMPSPFGPAKASLGGTDTVRVSIDYLSDTVMTIREAGRYWCGGGAPDDYVNTFTYDVRAGRILGPGLIFKDWNAERKAPTRLLADWVKAAYSKATDYDADFADGCLTDDNITDGLKVSFAEGDRAVFWIDGIEDSGCMRAFVTVPLVEIKGLLTDKAAAYFPSLKD
jgi:hypothetical protein